MTRRVGTGGSNRAKIACMLALLLSTGVLLSTRGDREVVVPHVPLIDFPTDLGDRWNGRTVAIDAETIQVLGAGDFAERIYHRDVKTPPVELFIGYFPTQRTGVSIHSPKNCLPGSGWAPIQSKYLPLTVSSRQTYNVNEYIIRKGDQTDLVLYWYQAHGRLVASEYAAKFYLIADSIRTNRSDAALVRIVTPIAGNEQVEQAEKRAKEFADLLIPNLDKYIPA